MLYIGQSNHVTFKVTVAGSSAEPEARVFVGSYPALCFNATRAEDGLYHADVDLPSSMPTGDADFRVEVLLNTRVFTPIKKSVPVLAVHAEPVSFATVPQLETAPPPEVAPRLETLSQLEAELDAGKIVTPEEPVVEELKEAVTLLEPSAPAPITPRLFLDPSIFEMAPRPVQKPSNVVQLPPVNLRLDHLKSVKSPKARPRAKFVLEGAPGSNITITKGKVVLA